MRFSCIQNSLKLFCLGFLFSLIVGCAGGTEGTGTRPLNGTVSDISGTPISGVEITELEAGDSDISDAQGKFQLETPENLQFVELEVKADEFQGVVTVNASEDNTAGISVNIKVDPNDKSLEASYIDVIAKIVGRCDIYFENRRIIRQSNRTPGNLICTARVEVRADGQTLGEVPFIIQYRACPNDSNWITLTEGQTLSGTHSGVGQAKFEYIDDAAHCIYRILAPYKYKGASEVEHFIYTFTKQAYDKTLE